VSTAPACILVPTDGSDNALRALEFAIAEATSAPGTRIELLNAQPAVRGAVAMFVPKSELDDYHRDEARKVLAPALALLERAGIPHDHHIAVGDPANVIAAFAKRLRCTQIVMGTRGLGGALGALLGSVAMDTLREVEVPVTLVK
jgi:nucleotide-binding universal stress UspA family protein